MRKSAAEYIRELEQRIARLERQAGSPRGGFSRGTITVPVGNKRGTVKEITMEAVVKGVWAYHKPVDNALFEDEGAVLMTKAVIVSHLPTGRKIKGFKNPTGARKFINDLHEAGLGELETEADVRRNARTLVKILHKNSKNITEVIL